MTEKKMPEYPSMACTDVKPKDAKKTMCDNADKSLANWFKIAEGVLVLGAVMNNASLSIAGLAIITHQLAIELTLIRRGLYSAGE